MSVERSSAVDAAHVRDGWVVLTIYQFESWEPVDDRVEELRQKLDTYEEFVGDPRFQMHFHRLPARVELVSSDEPPAVVLETCASRGVVVNAGAPPT